MNIDAKCNCPVCKKPAKLIHFRAKVGEIAELEYICKSCRVYFKADALKIQIEKGQIRFTGISGPTEVTWDERNFNPSER